MKRKSILTIAAVGIVTGLAALSMQAASPTLSFDVSDSFISVGDSFTVDVFAQENASAGDLTGYGFNADGPFSHVSLNGASVSSDYLDVSSLGGGLPYIGGAYLGSGNSGEKVLLATLDFKANTVGTDTLNIDGIANFTTLGAFYQNTTEDIVGKLDITVHDAGGSVPDSGTNIALFCVTLITLAAFRKMT